MHQGVRRMYADTTAPHLITTSVHDSFHKRNHVEKASATSTSPFLTLTSLLKERQRPNPNLGDGGKRKIPSIFGDCEDADDDDDDWTTDLIDDCDDDSKSSTRTDVDGKSSSNSNRPSNHSEIEKRRRDKMNNFITEIAALVPACAGMSRRMDKLSVLRLAVQHIKILKGSCHMNGSEIYKPSFVSDEELRDLIVNDSTGFLLAMICEDMKIFHVSENVQNILDMSTEYLTGQNFFSFVHPDDLDMVKSQIRLAMQMDRNSCNNAKDAKINGPSEFASEWSTSAPGLRRLFYCRIRSKLIRNSNTPDYRLIRCNGFLKFCASNDVPYSTGSSSSDGKTCMILMIEPVKHNLNLNGIAQFTSRHARDGKFVYVDQNITSYIGYSSQELISTFYRDHIHKDDLTIVDDVQKNALGQSGKHTYPRSCRFRCPDGHFVSIISSWTSHRNPWTGQFQFLLAQHRLVPERQDPGACVESSEKCENGNKLLTLTRLLLGKNS